MPSLASHPRLTDGFILKQPGDSTIDDISQVVGSDTDQFTSQAMNQPTKDTTQDISKKGNMSLIPDYIDRSLNLDHPRDTSKRPAFEELPYGSKDDPKASAWGFWGAKDENGTLNYLTPDVISHASKEITTGIVVPLK